MIKGNITKGLLGLGFGHGFRGFTPADARQLPPRVFVRTLKRVRLSTVFPLSS